MNERDVRRDDDYPESRVYFATCCQCEWESEITYGTHEEAENASPDECPACGGDLVIGSDWV